MAAGSPVARALAAPARCGTLRDIEHFVILIQENRSFDHYFGSYRRVRGFADPHAPVLDDGSGLTVFAQPGWNEPGYGGHLYPFHFDTDENGECTNDINRSWGPQHRSWNEGRLDRFLSEHLAVNGEDNGPNTMGYYRRSDLAFYYALADAVTICDGFFCSVIGPTDPNRLYSVSATLDPDGRNGGPLLETLVANRADRFGAFTWTTMPERLQAAGVDWKVYGDPDGNYGDNVLVYFKRFFGPEADPELSRRAFTPTFPGDFQLDAATGNLPQVSWVTAPLATSEHPPAPVEYGQWVTQQVLHALTANPQVWAKTALIVTYDENGGFFDHVPPPVAPPGTPGEWVTVDPADEGFPTVQSYPVPPPDQNRRPSQEPGRARAPSGPAGCRSRRGSARSPGSRAQVSGS